MKKILSVALALTTAFGSLTAVSMSAAAEDVAVENTLDLQNLKAGDTFNQGNFYYRVLDNGTLKITGIKYSAGPAVVIPAKVQGRKVTVLGDLYSSKITSVKIPAGVVEIDSYCFSGCSALKTVTIPNTVKKIGISAFKDCVNLSAPTIPQSVTEIGDAVFMNCPKITAVKLNANNKNYSVVNGVLFNKNKTKLIQYPNGKAGAYAIPATVTDMSLQAFAYSAKLTAVSVPKNVTYLWANLFDGCSRLAAINVNAQNAYYVSVNGIVFSKRKDELIRYPLAKAGAFTIPSTVKYIRSGAFCDCTKLTAVTIPNSVKFIYASAFQNTGLTKVTLPASLENVSTNSFAYCPKLTAINVNANNKYLSSIGGVVFNKSKTELLNFPSGKKGVYTVPTGVTTIGKYAFETGNNVLTCVKLPFTVTTIKDSAFGNCSKLSSVYMTKSVKKIEDFAFLGSYNLKTIYYNGTKALWNKISIGEYNSSIDRANIVCNGVGAIANLKANPSKNTVQLTWNKNTAASCYRVFVWKNNKWTAVAKTRNNSILKWTVSGLAANTTNYFRVTAYNKSDKAIAFTDVSARTLANVANLKATPAKNTVKLTWSKNNSASYYKVFLVNNGKYTQLAKTSSNATVSYIAKNLKANTSYKFRVTTYNKSNKAIAFSDITTKTLR